MNLCDKVAVMEADIKTINALMKKAKYDMANVATSTINDRMHIVSQSELMYGVYTALCIETRDCWKQNRIRFFCPLFHDPTKPMKSLPWAWPISAMGGFDDSGLSWVPPAGSTVALLFEGGSRNAPYYIGSCWQRNRGPQGAKIWGVNIEEYNKVSDGHRKGYLCGPNDESQCLPQWNTESAEGYDLNTITDFDDHPEAQKRLTYPYIYGMKTPEKHMLKFVDGDVRCDRRWKRIELLSSCGNWLIFKDDHLHYAGQWAGKKCGGIVKPGDVNCIAGAGEGVNVTTLSQFVPELTEPKNSPAVGPDTTNLDAGIRIQDASETDDTPKDGTKLEKSNCVAKIIPDRTSTPFIGDTPHWFKNWKPTKFQTPQTGDNPFFKHQNECRPYTGPQNYRKTTADLPQTGIQMMSISGHTMIMDDSVEIPTGDCAWERVLKPFDYGCNNIYNGFMCFMTHSGHKIVMSDIELDEPFKRSEDNFIRLETQAGNIIEMNDHEKQIGIAGFRRGIAMRTTSKHLFLMMDEDNEQTLKPRQENNEPISMAKKAFIKLKSGYGLEFKMHDDFSQQDCQSQFIQIFCPQKGADCGPHIMRFQEKSSGGQIFLRAGGDYITSTCRDHIEIVGDKEKHPSNKISIISKNKIVVNEKVYVNLADLHVFLAKKQILLLAGQDNPEPDGSLGPYPAQVVVYQGGKLKISDRIIGSCSLSAPTASIFMLDPIASMASK